MPSRHLLQRRRCTEPARQDQGRRKSKDETVASEPADIVVKSIADSKGKDRFYTSIRLPRQLWDRAGFGPDDRLLLDWTGSVLSVERTAEGGVKPKSVGGTIRGPSVLETRAISTSTPQGHRHGRLPAVDRHQEATEGLIIAGQVRLKLASSYCLSSTGMQAVGSKSGPRTPPIVGSASRADEATLRSPPISSHVTSTRTDRQTIWERSSRPIEGGPQYQLRDPRPPDAQPGARALSWIGQQFRRRALDAHRAPRVAKKRRWR